MKMIRVKLVAGGLGFEPRLAESESAVLPLNYPPLFISNKLSYHTSQIVHYVSITNFGRLPHLIC